MIFGNPNDQTRIDDAVVVVALVPIPAVDDPDHKWRIDVDVHTDGRVHPVDIADRLRSIANELDKAGLELDNLTPGNEHSMIVARNQDGDQQ